MLVEPKGNQCNRFGASWTELEKRGPGFEEKKRECVYGIAVVLLLSMVVGQKHENQVKTC